MAAEAGSVARALWERMEAPDWEAVRDLLADDFLLAWPQSGERIRGPHHFVAVNRAYPGDWHITVERVVDAGDQAVTEVSVEFADDPGRLDRAVSFFRVRDGRIAGIREFWPQPFAAAEWRAEWVERRDHAAGSA